MVSKGSAPQISEGVQSVKILFHYLHPKLMVCNSRHLNERECGCGESEVVYRAVGCYVSDFWSSQAFSTGHLVQFHHMNGIQLFWHKQLPT